MNKNELRELIVGYEDLILEHSRKLHWLIKNERGKKYMFAVQKDMHDRIIKRLEKLHEKLELYSGVSV